MIIIIIIIITTIIIYSSPFLIPRKLNTFILNLYSKKIQYFYSKIKNMSLHIVECGILQPCQPKCNGNHGKIKFNLGWKSWNFNYKVEISPKQSFLFPCISF